MEIVIMPNSEPANETIPPFINKDQLKNGRLIDDKDLIEKIKAAINEREKYNEGKKISEQYKISGKYKKGKEIEGGGEFKDCLEECSYSIVVTEDEDIDPKTKTKKLHYYAVVPGSIGQGAFGKVRGLQDLDTGEYVAGKLLLLKEDGQFDKNEFDILKKTGQLLGNSFERPLEKQTQSELLNIAKSQANKTWTAEESKQEFRIIKDKNSSKKFIEKKNSNKNSNENEFYLIGKGILKKGIKPILKLTGRETNKWYAFDKKTTNKYDVGTTKMELIGGYLPPVKQAFVTMKLIPGQEAAVYNTTNMGKDDHPSGVFLSALVNAVKEGTQDKQIIHRDIKLENIMFDEVSQKATVIDYGLAMMSDKSSYELAGSPAYIAPEIFIEMAKNEAKEEKIKKAAVEAFHEQFKSMNNEERKKAEENRGELEKTALKEMLNKIENSKVPLPYSEKSDVFALGMSIAVSLKMYD